MVASSNSFHTADCKYEHKWVIKWMIINYIVHNNMNTDSDTYSAFFGHFHFPNTTFSIALFFPTNKKTYTLHHNPSKWILWRLILLFKLTRVAFSLLASDDSYISTAGWRRRVCCCKLSKSSTQAKVKRGNRFFSFYWTIYWHKECRQSAGFVNISHTLQCRKSQPRPLSYLPLWHKNLIRRIWKDVRELFNTLPLCCYVVGCLDFFCL